MRAPTKTYFSHQKERFIRLVVSPQCVCVSSAVTEWGDDVRPISEEEAMVIVNHQSTGDVCTLMMCLQDKGTVRTDREVCCLVVLSSGGASGRSHHPAVCVEQDAV